MRYVPRRIAIAVGHTPPLDVEWVLMSDVAETVYARQRRQHSYDHRHRGPGPCPDCAWADVLLDKIQREHSVVP